jgi:hypothetical protein
MTSDATRHVRIHDGEECQIGQQIAADRNTVAVSRRHPRPARAALSNDRGLAIMTTSMGARR